MTAPNAVPSAVAPPRSRAGRVPLALATADQLLSSGTNVGFVYAASLLLPVADFGRFVLGMSVFTVLAATARGFVGEPMLAVLPGLPGTRRERAVRDAVRAGLLCGGLVWAAALLALPLADAPTRELLWIAVWAPAALLQDVVRYALLAAGRLAATLALDAVWAGIQAGLFVAILVAGRPSVALFAAAWGGSAACSAVLGLRVMGVRLRGGRATGWVRAARASAGWLTAGSVLGQLQQPLTLVLVAAALGPGTAGALRAMQLLALAAVQVVTSAGIVVLVPLFADRHGSAVDRGRLAVVFGVFAACGAVLGALLVLFRAPLVDTLFPAYDGYADLLVPLAVQAGAYFAVVPAVSMLRAAQRLAGLVAAQFVGTALSLLAVVAAAGTGSPLAVTWATTVAVAAWVLAAAASATALALGSPSRGGVGNPRSRRPM